MMKYFTSCRTIEDVKKLYRELAKKLHPDCGGNADEFKAMQAEYSIAFEKYKNIHVNAQGETYTKTAEAAADDCSAEEYADIIDKVIHFEGVNVEVIGSWVWLTGATMIYKDEIKAAGFWWSKTKKAWYYNGSTRKTRRRGRYSMEGLRAKWGSTRFGTDPTPSLT